MGAFFSTIANAAHKKADALRQQAHDANAGQIEVYKGVLSNPNATPEQRQFAADSLNKLYAIKPADSPFHKVLGVLNHVGQKMQQPPASAAAPTTATTAPVTAAPTGPNELDSLNPPAAAPPATNELGDALPTASAAPVPTSPPPQPKSLPPISFDAGGAGGATSPSANAATPSTNLTGAGSDTIHPSAGRKILGGVGKGLSAITGAVSNGLSTLTEPTGLAPTVPIEASQIPMPGQGPVKWDTGITPGSALANEGSDRFGNPIDPKQNYHTGLQNGRRVLQPAAVNANARPVALHPISVTDAQSMAKNGQEFMDLKGNEIDPSTLDKTMQVVPVALPGGKIAYTVTSQGQTHFNVGNEVYAVPQMEQTNLGANGVPLGQARVGTSRAQPGMTATGQPGTNITTTTPSTPGATPQSGLPPLSPATQMDGVERAPTGATKPLPGLPTPSSASHTHILTPSGGTPTHSTGAEPVYTPQQARAMQQTIAPVREGVRQIFGDPDIPDMPKMEDFAHILNDPARSAKVGSAIQSILQGMEGDETAQGGLTHAIENAGGLSAWKVEMQNKFVNDQLKNLNPEEREAVSSAITSLSTLVGFRSLNRGSAAQFSVKALERDIPIMGVNVSTPAEYYAKLGRIAEIAKTGMDTTGGFNAKEKASLIDAEKRMFALAKGKGGTTSTPPAAASPVVKVFNSKTGRLE